MTVISCKWRYRFGTLPWNRGNYKTSASLCTVTEREKHSEQRRDAERLRERMERENAVGRAPSSRFPPAVHNEWMTYWV